LRKPVALLLGFALLALALFPTPVPAIAAGPEHVISGMVRDLEGVPMAGVAVEAVKVDNGTIYQATTGEQGTYNLSLPEGTFNITATIASFGSNVTYSMLEVLTMIDDADFTIQVTTGRVEGHVTSKDAPLVGAQIVLSNGNSTYLGETSLPLGGYSITGVVPGVFVARGEMAGYWTNVSQEPVYVIPNEVMVLNFVLEPQPARIFGKVTVGDVPEEGVSASLMSGAAEVRTTLTDANGNYSFSNIIAGEYDVVFSKEGLIEKTYPVSVSPFEDLELSISMSRDQSSNNDGFIANLDLTHSMMVVALIVVMLLMIFALFIRLRVQKKPELLAKEEEEKRPSPPKEKK
jgi:hypothetical protein